MIYIAGWLFNYVMLAVSRWDIERSRVYCALVVLGLGILAMLRGHTGTDTVAYEQISAALRVGSAPGGLEPLYILLTRGLQWFFISDALVVRALAVISALLLLVYVRRADTDERYFLLSAFVPAFFYVYTMNTLRVGVASILLLLAVQQFRRSRTLTEPRCCALGVLGLFFQYTSAFSLCFLVAVLRPWSKRLALSIVLAVVVVAALMAWLSAGYFATRIAAYAHFSSPSRLSGLSHVIGSGVLLYGVWRGQLPRTLKIKIVTLGIGFLVLFFGVTQVSYSGLRLLGLLSFVLPLAVLCAYGMCEQMLDRPIRITLLIFGVVSAVFVFRNFLIEPASSLAPFLPYRSIF